MNNSPVYAILVAETAGAARDVRLVLGCETREEALEKWRKGQFEDGFGHVPVDRLVYVDKDKNGNYVAQ